MKKIIAITILLFWPINLLINNNKGQEIRLDRFTKTVFVQDYQAEQRVLDKINLYPSIIFARIYQNKARIYLDKINDNFFALIDPNNYFFGFHPREIIGNRNITKFPFISIIFFFIGLFYFKNVKYKSFVSYFFVISIFYLSLLENFDGPDLLLWLPITFVVLHGLSKISEIKRYWRFIVLIYWLLTIPEIIRIFL